MSVTFENRRSKLGKSFLRKSVMDTRSCLKYLLSESHCDLVDKLRRQLLLVPPGSNCKDKSFENLYSPVMVDKTRI